MSHRKAIGSNHLMCRRLCSAFSKNSKAIILLTCMLFGTFLLKDIRRRKSDVQRSSPNVNSRNKEDLEQWQPAFDINKVPEVSAFNPNEHIIKLNLKSQLLNECPYMVRPDTDSVKKYRDHYHILLDGDKKSHAYFLNTYYDDRFGRNEDIIIRTVGSSNFDLTQRVVFAAFWFPGIELSAVVTCSVSIGPAPMGVNALYYGYTRYTLECILPYTQFPAPPNFVTLSVDQCATPSNYIPVIIPYSKDLKDPYKIGNCMQSLYGEFTDEFAYMFINWMEIINMYGVSEVTVNLNNFTNSQFGEKIFAYYTSKGVLKITQYPDIIPEDTNIKEHVVSRIQSFIQLPFADCFFRNMHRYWFFAPLDVDEFFVLKTKHKTYQEYLLNYMMKHLPARYSIFLTAPVAGYFTHYTSPNTSVPKSMPVFRHVKRDKLRDDGHRKSFQNPRTCLMTSYHTCKPLDQEKQKCDICGYRWTNLPAEDMVLHHYRSSCKEDTDCLSPEDAIVDPVMAEGTLAKTILKRVRATLLALGYTDKTDDGFSLHAPKMTTHTNRTL